MFAGTSVNITLHVSKCETCSDSESLHVSHFPATDGGGGLRTFAQQCGGI